MLLLICRCTDDTKRRENKKREEVELFTNISTTLCNLRFYVKRPMGQWNSSKRKTSHDNENGRGKLVLVLVDNVAIRTGTLDLDSDSEFLFLIHSFIHML